MSYPPYGTPTPSQPRPPGPGGPGGYPPQPGYPPQGGFQPERPNRTPVLIGVIVGLVLVIGGLALFLLMNRDDGSTDDPTTAVAPTHQTIAPSQSPSPTTVTPTVEQVTVTAQATTTVTAPAPVPATQAAPPPPAPPPTQPAPQPAWPPAGASLCDNYVAVNDVTSCSFAYEVAGTYYTYGPGNYDVWSPVTGNYHNMTCGAQSANVVHCYGGTNAAVWFRQ